MVDGDKVFKALKLGKVTGLGCTLTSAECDYLIAHDDVLTQYITLLENDQLMKQRIAELEARIAELESKQRWISVSERLPEDNEVVLFHDNCRDMIHEGYHYKPNPQWSTPEGFFYHGNSYRHITHWMPLPESPIVYGKVCEE